MDLTGALKWVDAAVSTHIGYSLREPEIVILKGTWRGLTYEQMANDSEYSTNYLMRDVAPKLWKQLSNVFGRSVGKTNFRIALEAFAATNASLERDIMSSSLSTEPYTDSQLSDASFDRSASRIASSSRFAGPLAGLSAEASEGWMSEEMATTPRPIWSRVSATLLPAASISPSAMYGYEDDLAQLKEWLNEAAVGAESHSRIIGLWGLRGIGKTLLIETALSEVGEQFDGIVWCSLQNAPPLEELSLSILNSLDAVPQSRRAIAQLLTLLSNRSLVLVLEGVEVLLRTASLTGDYLPEHEGYSDFFKALLNSRSCAVVTGTEGPAELVRQGGDDSCQDVRSRFLSRLDEAAATALLQTESLSAPEYWPALIERYQGHPLALKSAARVIREMFNGRVDAFLAQPAGLFQDISRLMSPSFDRLSSVETDVLYWLAGQDAPMSLAELRQTLTIALPPSDLISTLDSLKQRSLLAVQYGSEAPMFYLPNLVKAYAFQQFVSQFKTTTATASKERGDWSASYTSPTMPVINLSPRADIPVRLSQWFSDQAEAEWHSLNWLFDSAVHPAMRLRNAYHLRRETFLTRCKPISLGETTSGQPAVSSSFELSIVEPAPFEVMFEATDSPQKPSARVILLVALHQDAEDIYKVYVQAQPGKGENGLPEKLALKLLDAQDEVLATVIAERDDTFIQLPYFRGAIAESFAIEIVLDELSHIEQFVI